MRGGGSAHLGARLADALRARQVDEVQLAERPRAGELVGAARVDRQDHVAAAAVLVHVRLADAPVALPRPQHRRHVVHAPHRRHHQPRHVRPAVGRELHVEPLVLPRRLVPRLHEVPDRLVVDLHQAHLHPSKSQQIYLLADT